jgi:hypothetical protein
VPIGDSGAHSAGAEKKPEPQDGRDRTLTGWLKSTTCPKCGEHAKVLFSTHSKAVYECQGSEHHCFETRPY